MSKKPRRRGFLSDKPHEDNQIVGEENELRIRKILEYSKTGEIRKTLGSGNVFGDQDGVFRTPVGNFRISCKHKQQSEPQGKTGRQPIPTLPYSEVLEPILYVRDSGRNEIPITAVTWSGNSRSPGKSDFVVLTMADFLQLLKLANKSQKEK